MIETPALTRCQHRLRKAIASYLREKGYAPSYEDLCTLTGIKSKSAIHRHINALVERGYVRNIPRCARSLELVDRSIEPARVIVKVDSAGQYLHTVKSGNVNVSVETVSG